MIEKINKNKAKLLHFTCDEAYHGMGIWWEKSTHTMGKVWVSISQTFRVQWVLLNFRVLWDGKIHAFPIRWDCLVFSCVTPRLLSLEHLRLNCSSLNNYPQEVSPNKNASRTVALMGNYISDNCLPHEIPLWTIIEKCFELIALESELYLSEATIVTGDPSKGGIVNPLIRAASIFYIFKLVLCYRVTKLKSIFFEPHWEFISSGNSSRFRNKYFKRA